MAEGDLKWFGMEWGYRIGGREMAEQDLKGFSTETPLEKGGRGRKRPKAV